MTAHRRFHLLCCIGYTLACLGWTVWAGRDQSWDFLNYHLYVALAWWQGRLPGELFAASVQGYLNPLPHLPYFAAFSTGWPALPVALLVATLHSANLWLLHGITRLLIAPTDRLRRLMLVAGVLLGGLTPAFLLETGTSFTDVIVSIPSLAALLCLMTWRRHNAAGRPAWGWTWLAALLAGVAMGLKPSALVFFCATLAAALVGLAPRQAWGLVWRAVAGGALGLLLAGGPHAWMLWRAFGSPVFPLFNGAFHSPWYADANAVSERFRPATLIDALWYPLRLANPLERVGFEGMAADIRPLTLIGLGVAALAALAVRRRQGAASPEARLLMTLLALFLPIWLYTSGNTRYAVQGLLLVGPAIAWLALRLAARRAVVAMLLVALPLFVQTVAAFTLNRARLDARDWSSPRMDVVIPASLQATPAYYLSLQLQSYAAIAAFLPAESRFTNLIGQHTLSPDGIAWRAVQADREARQLPWRTLAGVDMLGPEGEITPDTLDTQDAQLSEYALRIDRQDCRFIDVDGSGQPPLHWRSAPTTPSAISRDRRIALVTCAVAAAPPLTTAEQTRRQAVDQRMNAWERRCPMLFAPRGTHSQQTTQTMRRRFYVNTDISLVETQGRLSAIFLDAGRSIPLEDAKGQPLASDCPHPARGPQESTR